MKRFKVTKCPACGHITHEETESLSDYSYECETKLTKEELKRAIKDGALRLIESICDECRFKTTGGSNDC